MGVAVLHGVPGYVVSSAMKTAQLLVLPPKGTTIAKVTATTNGAGDGAITVGALKKQKGSQYVNTPT